MDGWRDGEEVVGIICGLAYFERTRLAELRFSEIATNQVEKKMMGPIVGFVGKNVSSHRKKPLPKKEMSRDMSERKEKPDGGGHQDN